MTSHADRDASERPTARAEAVDSSGYVVIRCDQCPRSIVGQVGETFVHHPDGSHTREAGR